MQVYDRDYGRINYIHPIDGTSYNHPQVPKKSIPSAPASMAVCINFYISSFLAIQFSGSKSGICLLFSFRDGNFINNNFKTVIFKPFLYDLSVVPSTCHRFRIIKSGCCFESGGSYSNSRTQSFFLSNVGPVFEFNSIFVCLHGHQKLRS